MESVLVVDGLREQAGEDKLQEEEHEDRLDLKTDYLEVLWTGGAVGARAGTSGAERGLGRQAELQGRQERA